MEYYLRLKRGKPISMVKHDGERYRHVVGIDTKVAYDRELWIAGSPSDEAVSVAIRYFQNRFQRAFKDLKTYTKADIREAHSKGASRAHLASAYNLPPKTVNRVLRERKNA